MLKLTSDTQILLFSKSVDFRKGIDGLSSLCKNIFNEEPYSGKLFVFVNSSNTMLRILVYDRNGFWLMTKRLSRGKYIIPKSFSDLSVIESKNFSKLLLGLCQ